MTTTLPETVPDAQTQPSPCSAPRADGPLAEALRRAEEERSRVPAAPPSADEFDDPLPPDLQPLRPPPPPTPEAMQHDIEALAREARSRDDAREALAIALEWPAGPGVESADGARAWRGWFALGAALLLASAAAAVAVALAPRDAPEVPGTKGGGLKMERKLSLPRASPPGADAR